MKLFTPESGKDYRHPLSIQELPEFRTNWNLKTVIADGKNGWMWVRGEAAMNSDGDVIWSLGAAQDITQRKKAENELLYLSYHDHLTELYNRRFFEKEWSGWI